MGIRLCLMLDAWSTVGWSGECASVSATPAVFWRLPFTLSWVSRRFGFLLFFMRVHEGALCKGKGWMGK